MAQASAVTKNVRVPPRKARLAADLIRGMKVEEAATQLAYSKLKAGRLLLKTLKSAIANAETQQDVQRRDLIVKTVKVDCGPVLKRSKGKSRGGSVPVMKRTSHFTLVVASE